MSGSEQYFQAVENRRTYYALSNEAILTDEQLTALVQRAVKHSPTSFNMQQSRAVLVTGKAHQRLWDVVTEAWNREEKDEAARDGFKAKVDAAYRPGYGSVIFFEDQATLDAWSAKMPQYTQAFNLWSDNAAGILQHVVWTALEAEGYGASLQHFGGVNTNVHDAVIKAFDLPESWKKNTAIMPFGKPAGPPGNGGHPKTFDSLDARVKVFSE